MGASLVVGLIEADEMRVLGVGDLGAAVLDSGGRVLLHCRAGLGRSGTLAALVLIERGMAPAVAMQTIGTARPAAIETAAQEAWLRGWGKLL